MIVFGGTADASMREVRKWLREAAGAADDEARDAAFGEAMLDLVNLAVVLHRGDRPGDLGGFRAEVGRLVCQRENRGNLGSYIATGAGYADSALAPGAYYEAALIRSAIELLVDDYPPVAEWLSGHSREMVADIDEALREAAEEVPPLPPEAVPDGLPQTHWWWYAPVGDPGTYELLHGVDGEA